MILRVPIVFHDVMNTLSSCTHNHVFNLKLQRGEQSHRREPSAGASLLSLLPSVFHDWNDHDAFN